VHVVLRMRRGNCSLRPVEGKGCGYRRAEESGDEREGLYWPWKGAWANAKRGVLESPPRSTNKGRG